VHRDEPTPANLPFQDELLDIVNLAPPGFELRWRPHPSDDKDLVAAGLAGAPGLRLTEASLAEDLGWSDVIVATNSSATIEALLWNRPIFLHSSPAHRFLPEVRAFDAQRCFFYAPELVAPFADCVARLDAGDPAARAPELRTRAALFGPAEDEPAGERLLAALTSAA